MARRSGRRPGNPDTREAILAAAREAFAERGFDAASIRGIATSAGVDPALVHHYFGTKEQLFRACMDFPIDPAAVLPQVLEGGMDGIGERVLRMFLGVWDSPAGAAGVALLRSALSNDWTARLMREFVTTQMLRHILPKLDVEPGEARLRASLVASQMAGLAMVRYVLKMEPLASAPPDVVISAVAPTVQRYIAGKIS